MARDTLWAGPGAAAAGPLSLRALGFDNRPRPPSALTTDRAHRILLLPIHIIFTLNKNYRACSPGFGRELAARDLVTVMIDNILCPFVLFLTLYCLPFVDIFRLMICTSHLCLPCLLLAVIRILSRLDSSTPRTPVSTPLAFVVSSLRLGIGSLLTDPPPPTHT